jgi:RNA polymerase sigma-70 factor (ECF subfamily)
MNESAAQTNDRAAAASCQPQAPGRASTNEAAPSLTVMDGGGGESLDVALDDRADYDQLYRMHHARVLRLCRLLLSDPHEADDVAQEVFIKVFQAFQQEDRAMVWGPWISRVAVNACRDRRRSGWWKWWRERHEEFVEADLRASGRTPEQEALSNETRRHVWRSFRSLSARQQEVFVLRHLEGWSTQEVAETLGLNPGSVKRHLYRAVHHMRKELRGHL